MRRGLCLCLAAAGLPASDHRAWHTQSHIQSRTPTCLPLLRLQPQPLCHWTFLWGNSISHGLTGLGPVRGSSLRVLKYLHKRMVLRRSDLRYRSFPTSVLRVRPWPRGCGGPKTWDRFRRAGLPLRVSGASTVGMCHAPARDRQVQLGPRALAHVLIALVGSQQRQHERQTNSGRSHGRSAVISPTPRQPQRGVIQMFLPTYADAVNPAVRHCDCTNLTGMRLVQATRERGLANRICAHSHNDSPACFACI